MLIWCKYNESQLLSQVVGILKLQITIKIKRIMTTLLLLFGNTSVMDLINRLDNFHYLLKRFCII
jgi:hypothetical protein